MSARLKRIARVLRAPFVYLILMGKARRTRPESFRFLETTRHFPLWLQRSFFRQDLVQDGYPWLTFGAVNSLKGLLKDHMRVFEFGSGGSTLFFAHRVKEVISVEHDAQWAKKVRSSLEERRLRNCKVLYLPAEEDPSCLNKDLEDLDNYVFVEDLPREKALSFKNYVESIDAYSDGYFDIVLIDGVVRPCCVKHACPKVKVGGYLVLDNSEQDSSAIVHEHLDNARWKKREYFGSSPHPSVFWGTCFWQRLT